jgi:hypothetical protein
VDIWKYDPANDSWTLLPTIIPINGLIFPASFVTGNKAYILSGGTAPSTVNETNKMWCLDGTNDSLYERTDFPGVARQAAFAFSIDSFGFFGGGMSNYTNNYYDMWIYDPTADQWSVSINTPLYGAAWSSTFVIGNTAYAGLGAKFVSGGLSGNDSFYKFNLPSATATNNLLSNENSWYIFPNPASEYIDLGGNISSSAIASVLDITGKIIFSENIGLNKKVATTNLCSGIYILLLQEADKISYQKFTIK